MSAAVILATTAAVNASHQSSGGSLGPAIFQLVGIVAVVVYMVVKSVSDGQKEHDDYMKRFSRDVASHDRHMFNQVVQYHYDRSKELNVERLYAEFNAIEYEYKGEWYKVGTGPLPRADWTETYWVGLVSEPPQPLNWRYASDGSPVYEHYPPAK